MFAIETLILSFAHAPSDNASNLNKFISLLPYGCEINHVVEGVVNLVSKRPNMLLNVSDVKPDVEDVWLEPDINILAPDVVETAASPSSTAKSASSNRCS